MGAFSRPRQSLETSRPTSCACSRRLDVCETGEHAFYNSVVESSFSPKHELFTSGPLRSMGAACCHVRHVQVAPNGTVTGAGASPKDLATGNFALVPLWTAGAEEGALIDEAHAESLSNTLPMRGAPIAAGTETFHKNMETLRSIDAFFHEPGKAECDTVPHQAIVSFASLVGNPNALADFAAVLKGEPERARRDLRARHADQPAWRWAPTARSSGGTSCSRWSCHASDLKITWRGRACY